MGVETDVLNISSDSNSSTLNCINLPLTNQTTSFADGIYKEDKKLALSSKTYLKTEYSMFPDSNNMQQFNQSNLLPTQYTDYFDLNNSYFTPENDSTSIPTSTSFYNNSTQQINFDPNTPSLLPTAANTLSFDLMPPPPPLSYIDSLNFNSSTSSPLLTSTKTISKNEDFKYMPPPPPPFLRPPNYNNIFSSPINYFNSNTNFDNKCFYDNQFKTLETDNDKKFLSYPSKQFKYNSYNSKRRREYTNIPNNNSRDRFFLNSVNNAHYNSGGRVSAPGQRRPRKMFTDDEVANLVRGVKKYGEGKQARVLEEFDFDDRTSVDLKDKQRNLQKPSSTVKVPQNRRARLRYSQHECEQLNAGVELFGHNQVAILKHFDFNHERTPVDLKDKQRNLQMRAGLIEPPIKESRRFLLLGAENQIFYNVYPRDAALKAATRGYEYIKLLQIGTPRIHVFAGERERVDAPSSKLSSFSENRIWKGRVLKLGMERATVAQLRTAKLSVAAQHGAEVAHDIAPNISIDSSNNVSNANGPYLDDAANVLQSPKLNSDAEVKQKSENSASYQHDGAFDINAYKNEPYDDKKQWHQNNLKESSLDAAEVNAPTSSSFGFSNQKFLGSDIFDQPTSVSVNNFSESHISSSVNCFGDNGNNGNAIPPPPLFMSSEILFSDTFISKSSENECSSSSINHCSSSNFNLMNGEIEKCKREGEITANNKTQHINVNNNGNYSDFNDLPGHVSNNDQNTIVPTDPVKIKTDTIYQTSLNSSSNKYSDTKNFQTNSHFFHNQTKNHTNTYSTQSSAADVYAEISGFSLNQSHKTNLTPLISSDQKNKQIQNNEHYTSKNSTYTYENQDDLFQFSPPSKFIKQEREVFSHKSSSNENKKSNIENSSENNSVLLSVK